MNKKQRKGKHPSDSSSEFRVENDADLYPLSTG